MKGYDMGLNYIIQGKMSYDLLALSVGVKYANDLYSADIIARRLNGFGIEFNERYPYAGKIKGTWFELEKKGALEILGSFDLCDFNFSDQEYKLFWRLTKKETDHYSLSFKSDVIWENFKNIIRDIQDLSPYKMVVFLPRLEGSEMNDICGVITLREFFGLIKQGRVYSNLCYIIQK